MLNQDVAPVIEDVGAPRLPWNPTHPAMTPLTDAVIECGLSHINAIREEYFSPKDRKPYNRVPTTRITLDEKRQSPQVVEEITALSSLDNQRLGMYQLCES